MTDATPQPKIDPLTKLTGKQRSFVLHYVACLNATAAARKAGYKDPEQAGYENRRKQEVREAIEALLAEQTMPKAEVLARLTAQAAGDMGEFLKVDEEEITLTWSILRRPPTPEGQPDEVSAMLELAAKDRVTPTDLILQTATVKRASARLDLLAAGEAGKLGLVKKYTIDKEGKVSIELYDAQAALVKLGEAHGIFRDRIADNLDAIAAAARSLDTKLMAHVGPGPAGELPAAPDEPGEGGPAL